MDSAASALTQQHKHCASPWCKSHQINSSKMHIFSGKVQGPSHILKISHSLHIVPEIMPIYSGRRVIVESPGYSITTDKYQKNLHARYVIGTKIIPGISLNAILQMDTADTSSLALCRKVREITKCKDLGTWHLSWFPAQKEALGHLELLLLLSFCYCSRRESKKILCNFELLSSGIKYCLKLQLYDDGYWWCIEVLSIKK